MKKGLFLALTFSLTVGVFSFSTIASNAYAAGMPYQSVRNNVNQQQNTQDFVNKQMYKTLLSINKSLNTLVYVTRGGEPPRKDLPLGQTVAGADGYQKPSVSPPKYNYHKLSSSLNKSDQFDSNPLDRVVQITWDGPVSKLLQSISRQVGFSFSDEFHKNISVTLEGNDLTVLEVLKVVSKQLDNKADIYVSLPNRSISLTSK